MRHVYPTSFACGVFKVHSVDACAHSCSKPHIDFPSFLSFSSFDPHRHDHNPVSSLTSPPAHRVPYFFFFLFVCELFAKKLGWIKRGAAQMVTKHNELYNFRANKQAYSPTHPPNTRQREWAQKSTRERHKVAFGIYRKAHATRVPCLPTQSCTPRKVLSMYHRGDERSKLFLMNKERKKNCSKARGAGGVQGVSQFTYSHIYYNNILVPPFITHDH